MIRHILLLITIVSLCFTGCSSMDDTYKDFIKDGPILYLSKIQKDSVLVETGWHRAKFTLPVVNDSRSKKIYVSWNNGKDSKTTELNPSGKTEIMFDDLWEGSIIFSCRLEDNDDNTSLYTDISAIIYGEIYQRYLVDRPVIRQIYDGNDLHILFSNLSDSTTISSSVTWPKNDGTETSHTFTYDKSNKITLEGFKGKSFKMKTLYKPDSLALDNIWSQEKVYPAEYVLKRSNWTVTTSHPWAKDGTIKGNPECLIDDNDATGLNLQKPGNGTTPAGATLFFVIDMKEESTFNYFSLVHRTSLTAEGLRIWNLSLYGSNDGMSYQEIQKNIDIPYKSTIKEAVIKLKESHKYRYVKAVYEKFSTTQNTAVQIMEFNLGMK